MDMVIVVLKDTVVVPSGTQDPGGGVQRKTARRGSSGTGAEGAVAVPF